MIARHSRFWRNVPIRLQTSARFRRRWQRLGVFAEKIELLSA
jgi:hypothetical protein